MSIKSHKLRLSSKEPLSKATDISALGSGAFGSVVKFKKSNSFFGKIESAVKFIAHGDIVDDEDKSGYKILREVQNATTSGHPNLVLSYKFGYTKLKPEMADVCIPDKSCYTSSASDSVLIRNCRYLLDELNCIPALWIGMEVCGPTLTTWLNQEIPWDGSEPHVQKMQLGIVRGLVEGLTFLHESGVLHRDLKPDNVFFSKGEGFVLPIKIGDLGLSRRVRETDIEVGNPKNNDLAATNLLSGRVGTASYMAPEIASAENFPANDENKFQPDLYSLGLIIWEVLQLIREEDRRNLFRQLKAGQIELVRDHAIILNSKDLILNLTHPNPSKRFRSIYDVKIETQTTMTFLARNSEEFHNYLEICSDGDIIYLSSGKFEGEFDLNRNNVIIEGYSKETVITGHIIGLYVQGNGNIVRNISFTKCYVCVQLNGCHNKVYDLHVESSNIGILTHKVPLPGRYGSYNEIRDISLYHVSDGIIIYGDYNKIINVFFQPMWRDSNYKHTAVTLGGSGHFVDGVNCIGLNYRDGDLGFNVKSNSTTVRNCKSGPIMVGDCDAIMENVVVNGSIELMGDKYKLINCIADKVIINIGG